MRLGEDISIGLTLDGKDFTVQVRNANTLLRELRQSLNTAADGTGRVQQNFDGLSSSFRHFMIMASTARFAVLDFHDIFLRLPMSIIRTTGEIERLTKVMEGLSTASDKATDAKNSQKYIYDLAQSAPFEVTALKDAFIKLKTGGIDPTNGSLQGLVDSVAKFGGSSDVLKRAAIAIQQMGGKGVISMEELRQQLGEALPNAIQIMAISSGKSVQEFTQQVGKGTVEAKSHLERMFIGMQLLNHGAAASMMDTWTGLIEQLKTKWQIFGYTLSGGDSNGGAFAEARKAISELIGSFGGEQMRKIGADIGEAMYEGVIAVKSLTSAFIENYEQIKVVGEAILYAFVGTKLQGSLKFLKGAFDDLRDTYSESTAKFVANQEKEAEALRAKAYTQEAALAEELKAAEQRTVALTEERNALLSSASAQLEKAQATEKEAAAQNLAMESSRFRKRMLLEEAEAERLAAVATNEAANAITAKINALRGEMLATEQAIAAQAELAITQASVGTSAKVAAGAMGLLDAAFAAVGGTLGLVTIAIMAGVWAWEEWGNAAEKAAERGRRAASKMSTKDDLKKEEDEIKKWQDKINANAALGSDASLSEDNPQVAMWKRNLEEAEVRKKVHEKNIAENAVRDSVDIAKRYAEIEVVKKTQVERQKVEDLQKEIDSIANQYSDPTSKLYVKNDEARKEAIKKATLSLAGDLKSAGIAEQRAIAGYYKDQISSIDKQMASETNAQKLDNLKGKRDAFVDALKRVTNLEDGIREKFGTPGATVSGKGAKEPITDGYKKHLENVERDLKIYQEKMLNIKGEVDRSDAIVAEVTAKYQAMLDKGELNHKSLKDGKVISTAPSADEFKKLVDGAIQAESAKEAFAGLKSEITSLTKEQAQYDQNVANAGSTADYSSNKIRQLNDEFERQKSLLGKVMDNGQIKAHQDRVYLAAKEEALKYEIGARNDLEKANIEIITDSQTKIQAEYAHTTRILLEEYQTRIKEVEKNATSEKDKAAEVSKINIAYAEKTEAARLRMLKATELSMNAATAKWAGSFMDSLIELTNTGKTDWKKMVVTMATDMQRILFQQSFGKGITEMFGGLGDFLKGAMSGKGGADGIGKMFSDLWGGIKNTASSLLGLEDSSKAAADATGNVGVKMIDELVGITTKQTAERVAIQSLLSLANAAYSASAALAGTGASSSASGLGSLIGTVAGAFIGGSGGAAAAPAVTPGFSAGDLGSGVSVGAGGGIVSPYANGGIMTSDGPLSLKKYANGGIANSPQLALFGEGAMNEAYVPLPDGRSIPVTMNMPQGAGVGSGNQIVTINITVNKDGSSKESSDGDDKSKWGAVANSIRSIVIAEIGVQKRPGGLLYK